MIILIHCANSNTCSTLINLFVVQSIFLKSVMLYNNGDFSSSARNMEQAITQYFEIYSSCLAGCEGSYEIVEFKDFYPTLAGKKKTDSVQYALDEKITACVTHVLSPASLRSLR